MRSQIECTTTLGAVALSVAELERSLNYYQRSIGLAVLERCGDSATLGVGNTPLLRLHEVAGARIVRRATGLYHFALRVPSRQDLARAIRHFAASGTRIDGASDHLFSEALYLSDPDGHGIEIYHDRPRDTWFDAQGQLRGASDPLDIQNILREQACDQLDWDGLASGTAIGHIHLQVANLAAAERFYVDVLGFERMARMPAASFVSTGGYHHHIGMNTWAGIGVAAPPERAARLLSYELLLSSQALAAVGERLRAAGIPPAEHERGWTVRDPSHNLVLLRSDT